MSVSSGSSQPASNRMRAIRRSGTTAELVVRDELVRRGIKFQTDAPIPGERSRPDLVFPEERLAVYLDGCFWHGCTEHYTKPKTRATWWASKLVSNRARDASVIERLSLDGWIVRRFWAHVPAIRVADQIEAELSHTTSIVEGDDSSSDPPGHTEK